MAIAVVLNRVMISNTVLSWGGIFTSDGVDGCDIILLWYYLMFFVIICCNWA